MKTLLFRLFLLARRAVYLSFLLFDKLFGRSSSLIILSYHSISNDGDRFSIDPKIMKMQLTFLKKNFSFITLAEVEQVVSGKKAITHPSVVLTVDDGYKDILALKPFFAKHNITPTLFVLSDSKSANWKELGTKRAFLTNREIKALKKAGWEIGSHSATHANLAALSTKALTDEVIASKKTLEKTLRSNVSYFAYPRGKYSKSVLKAVKAAKYKLGLTMDDGIISSNVDPLRIPRVGIDRTHSFSEFKAAFSPSVISGRQLVKKTFVGRYL